MKKLTDFQDSINKQTIQLFVKSIVKFQFFKDYGSMSKIEFNIIPDSTQNYKPFFHV